MDLKSDTTTDMMGPITALMGFQSKGLWEVTSPQATNTVGLWHSVMGPHTTNMINSPVMGPHTTNMINSPLLNPLGGSSEG